MNRPPRLCVCSTQYRYCDPFNADQCRTALCLQSREGASLLTGASLGTGEVHSPAMEFASSAEGGLFRHVSTSSR